MDTRSAVAHRILELCAQNEITISRLSTIAAVPPSTLKNIVYGITKNPGIVTIKKLCDGLGISLVEFFDAPVFHKLEQEIQ